jgi:hypothetical protein
MEKMVNTKKEDIIGKGDYEYAVPFKDICKREYP